MFPVGDDDSQRRTTPYVTYALAGLNVLVFLIELSGGDQFVEEWSFIPARFSGNPEANAVTIFTAMFMHGGWLHLFGNMLYLWIFGDNVEDQFGHLKFLIFLLAGQHRRDVLAICRLSRIGRAQCLGFRRDSAACSALIS